MLRLRQDFLEYVSFNYLDDKTEEYFMKPEKVVIARPNDSIPMTHAEAVGPFHVSMLPMCQGALSHSCSTK
jgi:hypothetical protein